MSSLRGHGSHFKVFVSRLEKSPLRQMIIRRFWKKYKRLCIWSSSASTTDNVSSVWDPFTQFYQRLNDQEKENGSPSPHPSQNVPTLLFKIKFDSMIVVRQRSRFKQHQCTCQAEESHGYMLNSVKKSGAWRVQFYEFCDISNRYTLRSNF